MERTEKDLRDWLVEMYHEKNMSLQGISKETGIEYTSLWRLFHKYGIAIRTWKKAGKVMWKRRRQKNG